MSTRDTRKKHSRKKTKKNCSDKILFVDDEKYNDTYENLITKWQSIVNDNNNPKTKSYDWEGSHMIEDICLIKFVDDIVKRKLEVKEIHKYARMIYDNILCKRRNKWFS